MHDYLMALIGGGMIGLSAVLLLATHGQIMGISGIASRLLPPTESEWQWRLSFLLGVFAMPLIILIFTGTTPTVDITDNVLLLAGGGLLVGLGTVIGNGCTSGHGVCGLSRFSVRSLVATSIFMFTAIVVVLIMRLLTGG